MLPGLATDIATDGVGAAGGRVRDWGFVVVPAGHRGAEKRQREAGGGRKVRLMRVIVLFFGPWPTGKDTCWPLEAGDRNRKTPIPRGC